MNSHRSAFLILYIYVYSFEGECKTIKTEEKEKNFEITGWDYFLKDMSCLLGPFSTICLILENSSIFETGDF